MKVFWNWYIWLLISLQLACHDVSSLVAFQSHVSVLHFLLFWTLGCDILPSILPGNKLLISCIADCSFNHLEIFSWKLVCHWVATYTNSSIGCETWCEIFIQWRKHSYKFNLQKMGGLLTPISWLYLTGNALSLKYTCRSHFCPTVGGWWSQLSW